MGFLSGKRALIVGVASPRSIAWGIAQKLHEAGATLAICYQNERMKLEAEDLIAELPGASGFQCDVSDDQQPLPFGRNLAEDHSAE